jgi:uncharacterized protein YjbI with pentapeptide repeats
MGKDVTGADGFEPPKYVSSLIGAINDGAKAAQAGALVFLLVGVYLLATAFSSSDEDLLRGKTVTILQIGAALPITFSFAIAPLVFVFVHVYTLARFDMLADNVRHFLTKLPQVVPSEESREDCRQLLANVEFVNSLTVPRGSRAYSRLWPWLFRGMVVVFPVVVLLIVQLNALRYQSDLIVGIQRAALIVDLAALVWFFRRNSLNGSEWPEGRSARAWRWTGLLWFPSVVLALNLLYFNVVRADADAKMIHWELSRSPVVAPEDFPRQPERRRHTLATIVGYPLDTLLCPLLNWGCRYLRVDYRTLVDHVWESKAIVELRTGDVEHAVLGIDGVVLRGRSLRFAVLDGSLLYAADLTGADLRGASLIQANLSDANLSNAKLDGADLSDANLQAANLREAELKDANLFKAQLQGGVFRFAMLQGANLSGSNLQGADLYQAFLVSADLTAAQLQGAELSRAVLYGAAASGAALQVADLKFAVSDGADLSRAMLQGADLTSTHLKGVDLRLARLWRIRASEPAEFKLADVRDADFQTTLSDSEREKLSKMLDHIPYLHGRDKSKIQKRLDLMKEDSAGGFQFVASRAEPVFASGVPEPFASHPDWVIDKPTDATENALATYLVDALAKAHPSGPGGISHRAEDLLSKDSPLAMPSLGVLIACRLLASGKLQQTDALSKALKDADRSCTRAQR